MQYRKMSIMLSCGPYVTSYKETWESDESQHLSQENFIEKIVFFYDVFFQIDNSAIERHDPIEFQVTGEQIKNKAIDRGGQRNFSIQITILVSVLKNHLSLQKHLLQMFFSTILLKIITRSMYC